MNYLFHDWILLYYWKWYKGLYLWVMMVKIESASVTKYEHVSSREFPRLGLPWQHDLTRFVQNNESRFKETEHRECSGKLCVMPRIIMKARSFYWSAAAALLEIDDTVVGIVSRCKA